MATARIASLADHVGQTVTLQGWLYNQRGSKALAFLEVRDGSGIVQVVVSEEEVSPEAWQAVQDATQESGIEVTGEVVEDTRQTGGVEVRASGVTLVSQAEPYPITPKEHGVEFLMDRRHLWLRSKRQWAIARVRNRVIMAIHGYFQDDGFIQMDAPILTGNAVEGTSTLFELDYFEEPAYLTQSGQLHGEAMAMAHGKIYTFGPTFRAEKSKTRRHLTEFWMIEPEMAFHDLAMNMEVAEGLLQRITREVIETCAEELDILERDVDALRACTDTPYPRLSYSEAVDLLTSEKTQTLLQSELDARGSEKEALDAERETDQAAYGQAKKGEKKRIDARRIEIDKRLAQVDEDLRNLPTWMESARTFEWGADFGGSDETVITKHFKTPIIVHRYPASRQGVLHEARSRGRPPRARHGRARARGLRRDHRRRRARDGPGVPARADRAPRTSRERLRLVPRPAPLRFGPARGLRPGPGAHRLVDVRPGPRARVDPVSAPHRPLAPVVAGLWRQASGARGVFR